MRKLGLFFLMVLFCLSTVFAGGAAESAVAEGPISIELWSSLSGSKAKLFDAQVETFNASQSDVKVNVIHQGGYSILRQKVAAASNAQNMPALLICDYLDVAYYAQLGLLESLDSLFSKELLDDFYPSMLADLQYNGELYALPYNRSTQGFFVNVDAMKKVGIEKAPETWDEFKGHVSSSRSLVLIITLDTHFSTSSFSML